jgi:hypothetical protein
MSKIKNTIFTVIKSIVAIVGVAMTAYSWVSTFSSLPPIIHDWRWSLGAGLLLLMVDMFWYVFDLYRKYVWWVNPDIRLIPFIKSQTLSHRSADIFCLVVENKEEVEITNCYATLSVKNLYGADLLELPRVDQERVSWMDGNLSNTNCEITVPNTSNNMLIRVADTINNFSFSVCASRGARHDLMGVNLIRVRLDGKMNGKNIKPKFFDGYLYIMNSLESNGEIVYARIFEKGNWMKDKRIPKPKDSRKAVGEI